MKIPAPDLSYIDYLDQEGTRWHGVRVWPDGCQAIHSAAGEGPRDVVPFGKLFPIPVSQAILEMPTTPGVMDSIHPITREILYDRRSHPAPTCWR